MSPRLLVLLIVFLCGCALPDAQTESARIRTEILRATPVGCDNSQVRKYVEGKGWNVLSDGGKAPSGDGFTLVAEAKKYTTVVHLLPLHSFAYATWSFGRDRRLRSLDMEIQTDAP